MGPALNMASALNGYALTDRGTWLAFRNRGGLAIVVEGDRRLFNQYGVMVVNPARHPHVKHASAKVFADWIVSAAGQAAIAEFKIGGEQAFFPNAQPRPTMLKCGEPTGDGCAPWPYRTRPEVAGPALARFHRSVARRRSAETA